MPKIFESPDGGKTIFSRDFGSSIRELIRENEQYMDAVRSVHEEIQWRHILEAAKDNPTLQAALDQCIMIYKLSKEYKDV